MTEAIQVSCDQIALYTANHLKNRQRLDEDGEVEQQCIKCHEWWPPDEQFYYPGFATCKACYLSAKYANRKKKYANRKKKTWAAHYDA